MHHAASVDKGSEETFSASQHKIGEQMAAKRTFLPFAADAHFPLQLRRPRGGRAESRSSLRCKLTTAKQAPSWIEFRHRLVTLSRLQLFSFGAQVSP